MQITSFFFVTVLTLIALTGSKNAYAFNTIGSSWASRSATFSIGNFPNNQPPSNSTASNAQIRQAFIQALESWNNKSRFVFSANTSSTVSGCSSSGNGAIFRDVQCSGSAFGSSTLAVTTIAFNPNTGTTNRTGIAFNNAKAWDVYSGTQPGSRFDFRRVAVHELGHALGLAHDDTVSPAIMRSSVGSVEVPQTDDINGLISIYGAVNNTNNPNSGNIAIPPILLLLLD